jgi:hypothetical protein
MEQGTTFTVETSGSRRRDRRREWRRQHGGFGMTVKASSVLSILVVWVTMGVAVAAHADEWPVLIFAFLTTGAVGISAWRSLGLSRLIAITGVWVATMIGSLYAEAGLFMSIFAFLSTAAVVYSGLHRDATANGTGIAAAWLASGIVVAANGDDAAWISVFAFLTAGALANTRGRDGRGFGAVLWWGLAAAVMIIAGSGWEWLCVPAFLFTEFSLGFNEFNLPRGIEWDLFKRDS